MDLEKVATEKDRAHSSSRKAFVALALFLAMVAGALGTIGFLTYKDVVKIQVVDPKNPDTGPPLPAAHTPVPAPQGSAGLLPPAIPKDPSAGPAFNHEMPPPAVGEFSPDSKDSIILELDHKATSPR